MAEKRYRKNPKYTEWALYMGSIINIVITVEARATKIMHMVHRTFPNIMTFKRIAKFVRIMERFAERQNGNEYKAQVYIGDPVNISQTEANHSNRQSGNMSHPFMIHFWLRSLRKIFINSPGISRSV